MVHGIMSVQMTGSLLLALALFMSVPMLGCVLHRESGMARYFRC
jgi:hypothetical protein